MMMVHNRRTVEAQRLSSTITNAFDSSNNNNNDNESDRKDLNCIDTYFTNNNQTTQAASLSSSSLSIEVRHSLQERVEHAKDEGSDNDNDTNSSNNKNCIADDNDAPPFHSSTTTAVESRKRKIQVNLHDEKVSIDKVDDDQVERNDHNGDVNPVDPCCNQYGMKLTTAQTANISTSEIQLNVKEQGEPDDAAPYTCITTKSATASVGINEQCQQQKTNDDNHSTFLTNNTNVLLVTTASTCTRTDDNPDDEKSTYHLQEQQDVLSTSGSDTDQFNHIHTRQNNQLDSFSLQCRTNESALVTTENCGNKVDTSIGRKLDDGPVTARQNQHDEDNGQQLMQVERNEQQQASLLSLMSEEVMCPVCIDILVQSTALVPCGHTVCLSCLPTLVFDEVKHSSSSTTTGHSGMIEVGDSTENMCQYCPVCREVVTATVACRSIDNVITSMIKMQQHEQLLPKHANIDGKFSEKDNAMTITKKKEYYHFFSNDDVSAHQNRLQTAAKQKKEKQEAANDAKNRRCSSTATTTRSRVRTNVVNTNITSRYPVPATSAISSSSAATSTRPEANFNSRRQRRFSSSTSSPWNEPSMFNRQSQLSRNYYSITNNANSAASRYSQNNCATMTNSTTNATAAVPSIVSYNSSQTNPSPKTLPTITTPYNVPWQSSNNDIYSSTANDSYAEEGLSSDCNTYHRNRTVTHVNNTMRTSIGNNVVNDQYSSSLNYNINSSSTYRNCPTATIGASNYHVNYGGNNSSIDNLPDTYFSQQANSNSNANCVVGNQLNGNNDTTVLSSTSSSLLPPVTATTSRRYTGRNTNCNLSYSNDYFNTPSYNTNNLTGTTAVGTEDLTLISSNAVPTSQVPVPSQLRQQWQNDAINTDDDGDDNIDEDDGIMSIQFSNDHDDKIDSMFMDTGDVFDDDNDDDEDDDVDENHNDDNVNYIVHQNNSNYYTARLSVNQSNQTQYSFTDSNLAAGVTTASTSAALTSSTIDVCDLTNIVDGASADDAICID